LSELRSAFGARDLELAVGAGLEIRAGDQVLHVPQSLGDARAWLLAGGASYTRRMRTALLSIALLAPACAAMASTDCTSTIASITVETGGDRSGYVVRLESGISFSMAPNAASSREVLAIVTTAHVTQGALTARFAADSVDCSREARRTDVVALVLGSDRTPTTITTPTPPPGIAPSTSVVQPPRP
jgi:hypothetical protein